MNRLTLPGTSLYVSPLCLGGAFFGLNPPESETLALLDHFSGAGGNFIDSARIYSDWVPGELRRSERILGDWMKKHGRRAELVISTKGAHPFIDALVIARTSSVEITDDLDGSLRVLRTGYIDLYWLHRDNTHLPVEHFIDLLNSFVRAGKIRHLGASNWSVARMREANAYAHKSGQLGFVANQPGWSLGCQHARPPQDPALIRFDAASDAFHRETGLSATPYSSQAGGFFTKLTLPADRRPADFEKNEFHTPINLETGRVVAELAARHRVSPNAIVLAYLWSARSYPVVPIIGARSIAHLEDSLAATSLTLTLEERRRLEQVSQSGLA